MKIRSAKEVLVAIMATVLTVALVGCKTIGPSMMGNNKTLYTKYNTHYYSRGNDDIANIRQYVAAGKNSILPYNTPVYVYKYRNGFALRMENKDYKTSKQAQGRYSNDGSAAYGPYISPYVRVYFEYENGLANGVSIEDYLALITSTTPVKYEEFSAIDKKGIADGKAYEGMTKNSVLIALGYPAPSNTSSLKNNKWCYWYKSPTQKYIVEFKNGIVINIDILLDDIKLGVM